MPELDRIAVLLHGLEGRPFREVGAQLGLGEDAARKRVDHAMDSLTAFFREHGFEVPKVVASAPLFTLAAASAPAGLAAAAVATAASALSHPAAIGAFAVGTAQSISKLMAMTPLKAGIAGALVATALTTTVLFQRAALEDLRTENTALGAQLADLDQLRAESARLTRSMVDTNELQRLRGRSMSGRRSSRCQTRF